MPEYGSLFPVLGSPKPSYSALFRHATPYAWRNRLRMIPTWRSERAPGEVPSGSLVHFLATLAHEPGRGGDVPELLVVVGGTSGQRAAQKGRRNGTATRQTRYADCSQEHTCAKTYGNTQNVT